MKKNNKHYAYKRIKALREQKHISQVALATRVGCSQNTISKIENGECDPRGSLLTELANFFGVSVDYLMGLSEHKYTEESNQRYGQKINNGTEYMEKYIRLSENSREAINILLDQLSVLEENSNY